ncbi:MAG: cyclic nucleotide-binding domain-containing protein [Desulfomonilaceae bacterium]
MDLRGKQGILEVIRLSYSITEFENTALFRKLITEGYTNLIYIRRIQALKNVPSAKMLTKHIEENNEEILRLIFYGLWISHSDVSLMYDAIKTDKAAIAVELMESTVRRDLVPYLIPLLEDIPIDRKIEIGRSMLLLPREDTITRSLTLLAQAEDPLTRLLAVMAIGEFGLDDAMIPVLEARLFDEHPGVIHAARTVLNDSSFEKKNIINPAELIETFRIFPIFEGLTRRELYALATIAEIRNFGAEETILHEGSESCPIHLIYSGTVNVHNNYGANKQTQQVSLGPGFLVGFVDMFTNLPLETTSVAAKPTQTFLFPRAEFQEIIRLYPQIAANMCKFCDLKSEKFYGV